MQKLPTGRPVVGQKPDLGSVPPSERLGVGIVGLHEGHTLLVALQHTGHCRAVAGCDLSDEKLSAARLVQADLFLTRDYEALLARADVHIVAIYTPDALHSDQIAAAFRAGKHVLCTKPLVNDPRQGRALLDLQRSTGRRLQVGQSTRFFESFRRQRASMESGALGRIELVDAHYIHRMDWFYDKSPWSLSETDWAFLGLSHPVDLVRWYLGPIRRVHAFGSRTALARRYGTRGFDAYVVNLESVDGRVARVLGNYGITELSTARSMIECLLMGEQGTSLAKYPELEHRCTAPDGSEVCEDFHHALTGYYFRHELKGMHYGEFANYADTFARAIRTGEPNAPELEEGLQTVCVLEAIRRSADCGAAVECASVADEFGL